MKYLFTVESDTTRGLRVFSHTHQLAGSIMEIRDRVFRPARKHGYVDPKISKLLETLGDDGIELIGLLEDKFNEVLDDHDVMEYS